MLCSNFPVWESSKRTSSPHEVRTSAHRVKAATRARWNKLIILCPLSAVCTIIRIAGEFFDLIVG